MANPTVKKIVWVTPEGTTITMQNSKIPLVMEILQESLSEEEKAQVCEVIKAAVECVDEQ